MNTIFWWRLQVACPQPLPFEEDFISEKTAPFLEKYLKRVKSVSSEDVHRCFRSISDLTCSAWGGVWQIAGVHGGGSPIMETIAILSNYNLKQKTDIAKFLSGIDRDIDDKAEVFDKEKEDLESFKKHLDLYKKS